MRLAAIILPVVLAFSTNGFALSPGERAFLKLVEREQDGIVIPLWPGDGFTPKAERTTLIETIEVKDRGTRIRNVRTPSIIVVPPPAKVSPTGVTIVFAPGGGYGMLSLPVAEDLCEWAGAIGAHFVLLKYSVPRDPADPGHRIPLSDGQRALRLLRSKATELKIDANKIIVVGSSAGGQLAFNLAHNHGEAVHETVDAVDRLSARPDAAVS